MGFPAPSRKVIAVATFAKTRERIIGPLIDLTATNEELGWTNTVGVWNTEVHYDDLFNLTECDLLTGIKGAATVRIYKKDKCDVDLPAEYHNIIRYSKIKKSM